jgi:hypothetical protein
MKSKLKNTIAIIGIIGTIFVTGYSCKKGDTGPQGPAGPQGPQGNNASFIKTNISVVGWGTIFNDGTDFWYEANVTWSAITQSVKDNGVVMCYFDNGTGSWYAMPFSESGDGYTTSFGFSYGVGTLKFYVWGHDVSGPPSISTFNNLPVKIVIITQAGKLANPNVNYYKYEEVKKVFNLD